MPRQIVHPLANSRIFDTYRRFLSLKLRRRILYTNYSLTERRHHDALPILYAKVYLIRTLAFQNNFLSGRIFKHYIDAVRFSEFALNQIQINSRLRQ